MSRGRTRKRCAAWSPSWKRKTPSSRRRRHWTAIELQSHAERRRSPGAARCRKKPGPRRKACSTRTRRKHKTRSVLRSKGAETCLFRRQRHWCTPTTSGRNRQCRSLSLSFLPCQERCRKGAKLIVELCSDPRAPEEPVVASTGATEVAQTVGRGAKRHQ